MIVFLFPTSERSVDMVGNKNEIKIISINHQLKLFREIIKKESFSKISEKLSLYYLPTKNIILSKK